MLPRPVLVLVSACLALSFEPSSPAFAGVTFHASQAAFAAVSATSLESTFEALVGGVNTASPIVQGVVTYSSSMSALPFYILKPGNPGDACCTFPHVTSAMLTGNGNEDWDMTFSGPAPTAVGFNYIANNTGITVTVYDMANVVIGTHVITTHNVASYLGLTSTSAIGRLHVFSQNLAPPSAQNSAIDNVAVGQATGTTAVDQSSWGRAKADYRR